MIEKNSKIYIAGHTGLVGCAIRQALQQKGYSNLLVKKHADLDLLDQQKTRGFLAQEMPEYVFVAAAKVGGIHANNVYRGDFIYQNLMIALNIINAAKLAGINRLLFLGSSCIYPKLCAQPIKEEALLSGPLEHSNQPYAVAKIAGIELCESYNYQFATRYVTAMPTNLYGPNDNFDLQTSHVLPALIRKIHEAKIKNLSSVTIWGSGRPEREFLHVDDLANACVFMMEQDVDPGRYNVGCGTDVTIWQLARIIAKVVGYQGDFIFDASKPDGTPKKLLDVSKLANKGWHAEIELEDGIARTYQWYVAHESVLSGCAEQG